MDGTGLYDVLHPDDGPEQSNGQIFVQRRMGPPDDRYGRRAKGNLEPVSPYGESEDPSSPHYNDQTKLHSQREIKRFWFSPQEIRDHTESVWGDPDRLSRHFKFHSGGRPKGRVH